jgi:hypothetical protein
MGQANFHNLQFEGLNSAEVEQMRVTRTPSHGERVRRGLLCL